MNILCESVTLIIIIILLIIINYSCCYEGSFHEMLRETAGGSVTSNKINCSQLTVVAWSSHCLWYVRVGNQDKNIEVDEELNCTLK